MTTRKMIGVSEPIHTQLKAYAQTHGLSMAAAINLAVSLAKLVDNYQESNLAQSHSE